MTNNSTYYSILNFIWTGGFFLSKSLVGAAERQRKLVLLAWTSIFIKESNQQSTFLAWLTATVLRFTNQFTSEFQIASKSELQNSLSFFLKIYRRWVTRANRAPCARQWEWVTFSEFVPTTPMPLAIFMLVPDPFREPPCFATNSGIRTVLQFRLAVISPSCLWNFVYWNLRNTLQISFGLLNLTTFMRVWSSYWLVSSNLSKWPVQRSVCSLISLAEK